MGNRIQSVSAGHKGGAHWMPGHYSSLREENKVTGSAALYRALLGMDPAQAALLHRSISRNKA